MKKESNCSYKTKRNLEEKQTVAFQKTKNNKKKKKKNCNKMKKESNCSYKTKRNLEQKKELGFEPPARWIQRAGRAARPNYFS